MPRWHFRAATSVAYSAKRARKPLSQKAWHSARQLEVLQARAGRHGKAASSSFKAGLTQEVGVSCMIMRGVSHLHMCAQGQHAHQQA